MSARSKANGHQAADKFRHPLMHEKTTDNAIVSFDGDHDPYHPLNWPVRQKVVATICYGLLSSCTTWETSIYASAIPKICAEFEISRTVGALVTSLFLFGLGLGPLLWAPLSELYGRRLAVLPSFFIGAVLAFGTAVAKDTQTLMITRFFGGFFSSSPMVNMGGVLADLYLPRNRAVAMVGYQMSVVGGPLLAPIVGGAIAGSSLSWRWTGYITGILMFTALALHLALVDETYPDALLARKARWLRYETRNWSLHAKHEEWNASFRELGSKYLIRPIQLLFTPICFAMCLYVGFVYALIYMCFLAFPIEFQEVRGWNAVVGSLPFIATFLGCGLGCIVNLWCNRLYLGKLEANGGQPVPEARLYPMMVGAMVLVGSLFLFGWTSARNIHWIGPCFGALLLGVAFITIFQGALNYLVDTFQKYSASAVAANTAVRSVLAGVFPLFTDAMFHNLGVNWASSLLAFIAVALLPIPFLFYIFGRRIRARGKWSRPSTLL